MCFSLSFLEQLLIWIVIVVAIVAILKLLVPFILTQLGVAGGIIAAAINIFVWAVVVIFVIMFCFMLIECLGGLHFPHITN